MRPNLACNSSRGRGRVGHDCYDEVVGVNATLGRFGMADEVDVGGDLRGAFVAQVWGEFEGRGERLVGTRNQCILRPPATYQPAPSGKYRFFREPGEKRCNRVSRRLFPFRGFGTKHVWNGTDTFYMESDQGVTGGRREGRGGWGSGN